MQSLSGLLVVLVLLCGSAQLCATAPTAVEDAHQQRGLLQDALSNSNGCLTTIPKCEPGACASRNVMGAARWVCLRCLANYEPVIDGSGQDNIIQCVCPKGFYEPAANATACLRCSVNSYCPGGDKVENPLNRGNPVRCGTNMVTRNSGARSQADCVSPAGYAQTTPNAATPCGRSEYAPAYNRLAKCLRCQSGLEEPRNSTLTDGQRINKRTVCMLAPGKYMSQGLVRPCPQGFYRENYVPFDAAVGTLCLPCRPGITTPGAGAELASQCNTVVPGHGIASINNVTGPQSIPPLPTNISNGGLPEAPVCNFGYYSLNGYCAQCPGASVTRAKGATTIEQCMVPPGYFLPTPGVLTPCMDGEFRDNWVLWSDGRAILCTLCGDNIRSEPRDLDENPLVANGSLIRATPTSCYINAGQGMIARGYTLFIGQDCPEDTYGAAGKVYGWAAAPCKPCPRNMITDGLDMQPNATACINPDGFGYASEGASRCAPGFYSAKGSLKPCLTCPQFRTTLDDPSAQAYITDCIVIPGYGVINSTANRTDAFNIDTSGMDPNQKANLLVMECPVGYYGEGGAVDSKCVKCPCGSSTQFTGTTNATGCSVCLAGYGKATDTATMCTPCPYGSFQPGGLTQCQSCPQANFYTPVDGVGTTWTSNGTTLFDGAFGAEACVPWQSQLSPEAGQAYFNPENLPVLNLTTAYSGPTLGACFAACPNNMCCMVQWDTANKYCRVATFTPVNFTANVTTGMQLMYKLPPSLLGSASSVKEDPNEPKVGAKTIASGYYATCSVPASTSAIWQTAGSNLGSDARTFSTVGGLWDTTSGSKAECQRRCDNSNVCWGFIYNVTAKACLYRGGVDALATRSFFALPSSGLQQAVTVDCAAAAAPPQPAQGALPAPICVGGCPTGQSCVAGQCTCPDGLLKCGTVCKNSTCDPNNCGYCGNICSPNQQCYNGICAEAVVACGSSKSFSGNEGDYNYSITIGTKGSTFNFLWDAYSFPDRFNVYLPNGTRIFTKLAGTPGKPSRSCTCSKCMSEETFANGNINLKRPTGVSSVKVVVNGYCPGTMWKFTVYCAQ